MRLILLVVTLFCVGLALAEEEKGDYIYSGKIIKRFKITEVSPYKEHYLLALRYQMLLFELNDSDNTFCAIGYQLSDGLHQAPIFWDKGKQIIGWEAEGYDFSDYMLRASAMDDSSSIGYGAIVPRNKMTMGMINYYAKEDVDLMRKDCERNGDIITVKAFPTSEACKNDLHSFDCIDGLEKIK